MRPIGRILSVSWVAGPCRRQRPAAKAPAGFVQGCHGCIRWRMHGVIHARETPGMSSYGAAKPVAEQPGSIDESLALLKSAGYVADRSLATVLFLALKLGRPLFLEGEAG